MVKPPSGGFLLLIERVNGDFREDGGTPEQSGDGRPRRRGNADNKYPYTATFVRCSSHCDLRLGCEAWIDADCWGQWLKGESE